MLLTNGGEGCAAVKINTYIHNTFEAVGPSSFTFTSYAVEHLESSLTWFKIWYAHVKSPRVGLNVLESRCIWFCV